MSQPALRHAGINLGGTQEDPDAKAESGIFGFWIFLMSDAVIFALLFAVYDTVVAATAGGPTPAEEFKLDSAFIETLLLLTSSLTIGMAVLAMKYDAMRRPVFAWMGVTFLLGLAFLGMEWRDFATMFSDGAYPTRSGFLSAFFALVPLHGIHVLAGCVWMHGGPSSRSWLRQAGKDQHSAPRPLLALPGRDLDRDPDRRLSAGSCIMSERRCETSTYLIGYALALLLTLGAFVIVRWPVAAAGTTLAIIMSLALVQMIVQFRCFLHIRLAKSSRHDLLLVLFSSLIITLMVSGTLVILFNLRHRMM